MFPSLPMQEALRQSRIQTTTSFLKQLDDINTSAKISKAGSMLSRNDPTARLNPVQIRAAPLSNLIQSQPKFSKATAAEFLQSHYGISGILTPLDSERDQNFLVAAENSQKFVLKIANSASNLELIELENEAMNLLKQSEIGALIPAPISSLNGKDIELFSNQSNSYPVRLVEFLEGSVLANHQPHSSELMLDLGTILGTMTAELARLKNSAAQRDFHWNLDQAYPTVANLASHVDDPHLIDEFVCRFRKRVLPHQESLRKSIVHNDANDHNLIISPEGKVTGIIDFGDIAWTSTVNELAICLAYVMMNKPDPVWSASHVVQGFHQKFPLTDLEIDIVFDLACMRLCTSTAMSGYQRSLNPDNDYLSVSDLPARRLLRHLVSVHSDFAAAVFRSSCQRNPVPQADDIERWLTTNQESAHPVLGKQLNQDQVHVFDLSVSSKELFVGNLGSDATPLLFKILKSRRKSIGVGRYGEPRICYQGDQFGAKGESMIEPRTIHMGIDLFAAAGTPVYAPFAGTVHSFANNDLPFDYGPTILLEHLTDHGETFFTLYGHLSKSSIEGLEVGAPIQRGEEFATFGTQSENGGWTPHLHFQIMTHDLGMQGDFPGVVKSREIEIWKRILLDPNLILKIPLCCFPEPKISQPEIQQTRAALLNPSLSLSYDSPLHIVRGQGACLFDAQGHRYLDCVNNVCHVGHSHPHVVAAAAEQWSVLNTNTRYLHEEIVRYAERLSATLPKGLDVCYFVNSGSEANDLALRLARNYTNRKEVICVDGAYHGNLTSLIEISPYKFDSTGGPGKPDSVHMIPMPDSFRGQHLNNPNASNVGEYYAQFVQSSIDHSARRNDPGRTQSGHDVAAFICESILSCGGQIVLPDGFLQRAYQIARQSNVVCIADEVQVGLGRVGSAFWAFESQGVIPDIVTMGKPLGNGFPLGAVVTTRPIADAFNNGLEYFNTFGGSPVACAVGNAVLDIMGNQQLLNHALQTGNYFLSELIKLKNSYFTIGDVRGQGLFLGIEFVQGTDRKTPHPALAKYVVERMKQLRILLSTDGPQQNVIKIKPPLSFQKHDVDQVIGALNAILQENYPQQFEMEFQAE